MKIKKSVKHRAINFNLWPNGQWRCHLVARFGPPFRLCAHSGALDLHPPPRQTFSQLA
jgi:hypothetical protein